MEKSKTSNRYSPEVQSRAVRMVLEHQGSYETQSATIIVWAKDNGGMGTFYRSRHELIFAFKNGTAPHTNSFELGQHGR